MIHIFGVQASNNGTCYSSHKYLNKASTFDKLIQDICDSIVPQHEM